MATQVLNLRAARPEPGDVRIDRKSRWGNPFIIGRDGDRAQVIAHYETKLRADLAAGPVRAQDVAALHGRRLFCWCAPLACHGHVLARIAAELQPSRADELGTAPADAAYEHEWAIECRAAELFRRDFPTGTLRRTLPQFRSSYPDPIGDSYRAQARAEMEGNRA